MGGNSERNVFNSTAGTAWSGWVWWVTGMTEADRIDLVLNGVEEVVLATYSTGTQYAYPASIRAQSSASRDMAVNEAKDANQSGLTGTSIIDTVIDVAKQAWGIGKKLWGAYQTFGSLAMAPPSPEMVEAAKHLKEAPRKEDDEIKVDEFTPVDLPRDRRQTLPRLLSVDDSQTPRVARK